MGRPVGRPVGRFQNFQKHKSLYINILQKDVARNGLHIFGGPKTSETPVKSKVWAQKKTLRGVFLGSP